MNVNILRRLEIKKLKGLMDVKIELSNTLTAIMGVNGSGKTTILHALACVYMKERVGEEYKFSNFLVPNPDSQWAGSELSAVYWQGDIFKKGRYKGRKRYKTRIYIKKKDRWTPSYGTRPKRDVFYLGIDSCLPEIERRKHIAYISYTTQLKDDRISNKVIMKAAFILNKDYASLLEHKVQRKHIHGVRLNNGLNYSALSMGTGEQRVIKILDIIFRAHEYSLILIDEIDLLLHINAFKKLLGVINEEAEKKKLQVVFTTHSLMINEFDFVKVRYIEETPTKTLVYTSLNTDMIYSMTGIEPRSIKVYVEDPFAQAIIKKIAKELNMLKKVDVHIFGSAENAFTLAASIILKGEVSDNILIVIDGDVYVDSESKLDQIKKHLSGTEESIEAKWVQALALINQLSLPDDCRNPEKFIHRLLSDSRNPVSELVVIAREIRNLDNKHKYINDIVTRLGDNYDVVVNDILTIVSKTNEWTNYTLNIRDWLEQRANI